MDKVGTLAKVGVIFGELVGVVLVEEEGVVLAEEVGVVLEVRVPEYCTAVLRIEGDPCNQKIITN